jgi:hypothetical protein
MTVPYFVFLHFLAVLVFGQCLFPRHFFAIVFAIVTGQNHYSSHNISITSGSI